ncbi:MAG: dimethylsulfoniopropionate lyase [Arenicellales bacterium]|nr:dimethylsulfoniopropionate lyase [Arenicellales bacterium]
MQTDKVIALICALRDALSARNQLEVVQLTVSRLSALTLDGRATEPLRAVVPHFESELELAISHIPDSLNAVAEALSQARPYLDWRADIGGDDSYYEKGSDVGLSFREGNLVCSLVGPANSFVFSEDLFLSLFFLKSRTLYRDHVHQASEMYFNLSGPCGFRLGDQDWVDYAGDSVIWNPPLAPHATRVYETPFLSAVSWVSDLDSVCRVVHRNDWQMIEGQL